MNGLMAPDFWKVLGPLVKVWAIAVMGRPDKREFGNDMRSMWQHVQYFFYVVWLRNVLVFLTMFNQVLHYSINESVEVTQDKEQWIFINWGTTLF